MGRSERASLSQEDELDKESRGKEDETGEDNDFNFASHILAATLRRPWKSAAVPKCFI